MSKNKLMITLVTLVVVTFMGGVLLLNAQEIDNQTSAENILSILTSSESEVTELFDTLNNEGIEIPEQATEAYNEAQTLRTEAQSLFDEENYEGCIDKATDALNKYGDALEIAQETLDEQEEIDTEQEEGEDPENLEAQSAEEKAAKMLGVKSNIEKLENRIDALWDIVADLDTQGIDTEEAKGLLDMATEELGKIKDLFDLETLDESEVVLGRAIKYIGQATGLLKSSSAPLKALKVEQFTAQVQNRVEQLSKRMTRVLSKMGPEDNLGIQAQYDDILAQLDAIDSNGDLHELAKQLQQLVKESHMVGHRQGIDGLSVEVFESVDELTDLQLRINEYREIVESMDEEDPLKEEALNLIEQAETKLEEAETAVSEGNEVEADQLVQETLTILESIEDLVDDGNGHGVGTNSFNETADNKSNSKSHKKDEQETDDPDEPETTEEPETSGTDTS